MSPRPKCPLIGTAALVAIGALIAVVPATADTLLDNAAPGVGVAPKPAAAPRAPVQAMPGGNPVHAIPLAELNVTRDRPIFSPSRRPPPPPPPAPVFTVASVSRPVKTEPERPQLTLVGTIVGTDDAIAVFLNKTTREVVRLHTSESHEGWTLRSIQGREATLEKGVESAVLVLPPPGGTPEIATAQATPEQLRRSRR